jgi:hypothetical protein
VPRRGQPRGALPSKATLRVRWLRWRQRFASDQPLSGFEITGLYEDWMHRFHAGAMEKMHREFRARICNALTHDDRRGDAVSGAELGRNAPTPEKPMSRRATFKKPAYPQTVPGMQSWAGFYGGNVQAPSFLPQQLGPSQAGPAPTQPGSYSGAWANPQTWGVSPRVPRAAKP